MKSSLKEVVNHGGVIVKHGDTEIECKDDAEAIQVIKDLGYTEADIIHTDGSKTSVKG